MPFPHRKRCRSPLPTVTVELGDDSDNEPPPELPKRRRGRPKNTPESIEFSVGRPSPPDMDEIRQVLLDNAFIGANPTNPPKPSTYNDFDPPPDSAPGLDGSSGKEEYRNKAPNDLLKEWLDYYLDDYVDTLYERDAPSTSGRCSLCRQESREFYRCTTCIGAGTLCSACTLSIHRYSPTHRIKFWDGTSWVDKTLADLNLIVFLGHNGEACSSNDQFVKLYIGDINGFNHARVRYCTCRNAPSKPSQLLRANLFPCSNLHPESAFTFALLDMHNILVTHARTSTHKYYSALERFTQPGFSSDVDDRYRELMATHRRYLHLLQLRRSGHKFPLHPDIDVHPGDQALDCVACPRPGFNFEWEEIEDGERVWFRIWISFDGNFRSIRKNKRVAAGDICLSDDLAYFPAKEPYKLWTETVPQPKRPEKPTCNHHKAGNELSVRWVGQDVTGVGLFSCTAHTCALPRGLVDFFKGERFMYSDYALGSLLSHMNKRRGGSAPIGITYDVMCHWIVKLFTRIKSLPPSISIDQNLDLVGAIPKWHLVGHERQCYIRWSLDNILGVGRMDGEAPERLWSHLNQSSGSTSEQSPGVRTDTMNNIIRVWNEEKAFNMHESRPSQYNKAVEQLEKQKKEHNRLTGSLPATEIAKWEKESIEPVQGPNKKWSSLVMDPVLEAGFHETVKQARQKETKTTRVAGRRPGATRWIADGIELENSIQKFNDEAKELGDSPTTGQASGLNKKRLGLRTLVEGHRKRREVFMANVDEPDKPRTFMFYEEDAEHEVIDFGMPSSYAPETIVSIGLESLAEVEMELRKAMCKESLESVKRLLTTKKVIYQKKKTHVRGQEPVTRANAKITEQDHKISKARWRYTNSRQALIQLGHSEEDLDFQELTTRDLKPLGEYFDEYATSLGHGYCTGVSWIWKSLAAPNTEEWEIDALKTEWFQSRERYKRWEEQLFILKREMIMTIRSFQRFQELWEWKSSSAGVKPGMRAYACGRAKFYEKLAIQMLKACREQLYDETVEFKWCNNWLKNNVIAEGKSVNLIKR